MRNSNTRIIRRNEIHRTTPVISWISWFLAGGILLAGAAFIAVLVATMHSRQATETEVGRTAMVQTSDGDLSSSLDARAAAFRDYGGD